MYIGEIELILRLVLAAILGAIIGFEREAKNKPAGIRTHSLVSLGACIFTLASIGFGLLDARVEPSRIAAGIVTGIGFLGAGAIFRSENKVSGLTTAADLWVVAAIGLAVALGEYLMAAAATAIAFFILYSARVVYIRRSRNRKVGKR
ncbi:MAG: MgtC/SapB family protein [Candidatus Diapherotrites archaeon]|nr:MgtC/SapB family protein [Candidatus Diapherotrites archaeon]